MESNPFSGRILILMSQQFRDKFHTFSFFIPLGCMYRQYFEKFLWHKNLNAISELICIEVAKNPEAFVRPTGISSSSSSLNDSITSLRFSLYCHALLKMMI